MRIQDPNNMRQLEAESVKPLVLLAVFISYRIIRFTALSQVRRRIIDSLDHARDVLAHLIQSVCQLLGKLVRSFSLLIGALQALALPYLPCEDLVHICLVPIKPRSEFGLLTLDRCKLSLNFRASSLGLVSARIQLLYFLSILNQQTIPSGSLCRLFLEFLLILQ